MSAIRAADEHKVPIETIVSRFGTNVKTGLTNAAAQAALKRFGGNELSRPKAVRDTIISVKVVMGCASFLLWTAAGYYWAATSVVWFVVKIFVAMLTMSFTYSSYRDYRGTTLWEGMQLLLPSTAMVVREGLKMRIRCAEVVPGDLVVVGLGSITPADLRIVSMDPATLMDHSRLSGDLDPRKRTVEASPPETDIMEATNIAFASTKCSAGGLTGICVQTADRTLYGRLMRMADVNGELSVPIRHLVYREVMRAVLLSITMVICGIVVFGVGLNIPAWIASLRRKS